MSRRRWFSGVAAAVVLAAALTPAERVWVQFENVAARAGLKDVFPNGGDQSKRYIIETTGSGAGIFDYDNDGLPDLFLVSGLGGSNRLYRNLGRLRFRDVTEEAGLSSSGWGKGICAGDYDNDGFTDIVVTFYGELRLYRNLAGKSFSAVTEKSGLQTAGKRYHTGCAFLDYDRDGDLDLFVSNYLRFDVATAFEPGANPYCFYREMPVNCGPRGLKFDHNLLFRNNGDGTFTDVSTESGIARPNRNYALGVLTGDFNGDGWPDIYVACDQTPSLFFVNDGKGRFEEEALLRGTALDENGKALSGMGATAADYDGDGWLDIFRTNFSDERETLYKNRGRGDFEDVTVSAGLGHNTRFVGWGCGFFDFDNDGWKDLLLVNGHVFPEVDRLKLDIQYRDRPILYHNTGAGKFEDISQSAGPGIQERHSSRGAAFGDLDNDGTVDVLINNQNDPPSLLQSHKPNQAGNWLILNLEGTRSNRSAIGAVVRVTAAGRTQVDEVRSGGSYLSQGDLRLHFGLGSAEKVDLVEIRWPSGGTQSLQGLPVNQIARVKESEKPQSP